MIEISDEQLNQKREKAENFYKNIKKVWCPYFKENVHFNSEGYEHLLFKEWNKTRSRIEQYMRLRLLPFAPKIIGLSHTLQEYAESKRFERRKINSRWEKRLVLVRYYVFIAILNETRFKIIVKEVEGGAKMFHSIYPSWKKKKNFGVRLKGR